MASLLKFTEVSSTNTYLKEHFEELPDKTVVTADIQTAGRGRFDRRWISQPGGLYFSVLVKPQKTDFIANLTQLMALSVCQAAEQFSLTPTIKWPNDVLLNNKKLCGILSEAVAQEGQIAGVVVGCGVNVAQEDLSSVGQPAVSLKELGVTVDKYDFLNSVLTYFWQGYENVLTNGFCALQSEYQKRFPLIGQHIAVKNGSKEVSGVASGLTSNGTLLVTTGNGPQEVLIGDLYECR